MKNRNQELHVIFGTGPADLMLAEQLSAADKHVRLVNRSGKGQAPAGTELVAGDALQSDVVRALCQGAVAVYHCANVLYQQQVEVIPHSLRDARTNDNGWFVVTRLSTSFVM